MFADSADTADRVDTRRALKRRNIAAVTLLLLGSIQMLGVAVDSRALRGLGAALAMAPNPKVFSDVDGLETFASEFTLFFRDAAGAAHSLVITPEVYGRIRGPYNRRNVYGAALSYAPRMPEALWTSVYCHGLSPHGPLRHELGLAPTDHDLTITIRTRTRGRHDAWTYAPAC
ncbi:MAG TPA: hypothetical protein VFT29_18590 [Gemmatimonadaceae bacterium]|nr:hypothetical protein [Gemmatimonadaceae bacterium]